MGRTRASAPGLRARLRSLRPLRPRPSGPGRHPAYPFAGAPEGEGHPGLTSVVIVHYRGEADLFACVASARAQGGELELLVVDNGSADGAVDRLGREAPGADLRVLRLPRNLGFAAAADLALRRARGGRVLLLNPDARLEEGALAALGRAIDSGASFAAPRILLAEDPERLDNCGHGLYPDGLNWCRGRGLPARGAYEEAEDILLFSGAAVLIDRKALDRVGGLDPDYFAYGEDADLSLRAARAGLRVAYVPEARVRHRVGGSFGRRSAWKVFLVERNRARVALVHLPARDLLLSPWWTARRHAALAAAALRGEGPLGDGLGIAAPAATLAAHAVGWLDLPGAWSRRRALRRGAELRGRRWRERLGSARVDAAELVRRPPEG